MATSAKRDARAVDHAERAKRALAMRRGGASYEQIGVAMGLGKSAVHKIVAKAIDAIPREEAEHVRALELARLDAMLRALWERAAKGSESAIGSVLLIMNRRARLLGLDAALKKELSGPEGGPILHRDITQLTDEELDELAGTSTSRDSGEGGAREA